jgi:hypothetical protein
MATDFNGQNAFNITNRRRFLKNISVGSAAFAATDIWTVSTARQENMSFVNSGTMPYRAFGHTGVQVSILGIGGYTIGEAKTEAEGIRIIHKAMDAGINFMDNSWEYHDGLSEEWMGKALKGRRDKAFLMSKVCTYGCDAKVAMQALRDRCAIHAADGRFELYKTSKRFDGPPGREQHGFPSAKEMES